MTISIISIIIIIVANIISSIVIVMMTMPRHQRDIVTRETEVTLGN